MKLFVIVLLGLGLFPVITEPFNIKVSADDNAELIRYKMELIGLRGVDIARAIGLSEDYVQKNISGLTNKKRVEIISFINKSIM